MAASPFLPPADAARRLGVSAKALRLWEERGLIAPGRTVAGWRTYGPGEMARAAEIVALRALGLSLAQIERALAGDAAGLEPQLAAHQSLLAGRLGEMSAAMQRIRAMRAQLAAGTQVSVAELAGLQTHGREVIAAFDLPWPWDGERFELRSGKALTWIVGPLFSGKTKLATKIAETVPGAVFVALDRRPLEMDAAHAARVARTLGWLVEDGATESEALLTLVSALEAEAPLAFVVDLIEQGLDEATQLAMAAWLRGRTDRRPVFAMTRSSAMLDLSSVGVDEALLLCPANHSPPVLVAPYPGAPGYEVLASCLGPPEARARTEGVIAIRPTAV